MYPVISLIVDLLREHQSYCVTFRRFLNLISDPPKWGVYVPFVWWWIYLRPCERVCWINICFSKSIHAFPNIKINSVFNQEISRNFISSNKYQGKRDRSKKESERVRQRERRRERERKRESVCAGLLHVIITHVHVRVNIFAKKRHCHNFLHLSLSSCSRHSRGQHPPSQVPWIWVSVTFFWSQPKIRKHQKWSILTFFSWPWPWPAPSPRTPGGILWTVCACDSRGVTWQVHLTWQVDLTSCHLSNDLKMGWSRGWQVNLTSAICQVPLVAKCSQNTSVGPWIRYERERKRERETEEALVLKSYLVQALS